MGAIVGGWIGRAVGVYGPGEGAGMLMSILGAVFVLTIYRVFARRRTAL